MRFPFSPLVGFSSAPLRRRVGVVLAFLAVFDAPLRADPAANALEVQRLIAQGAYGKKPMLWFAKDAERNLGDGPSGWAATSGGRLAARGADPWGRPNGAFGVAADATGGAAVSGSKAVPPINPRAGTVLMFCRPAPESRPPMLLFTNADWAQPGYFSLRVNEMKGRWELTLATTDARSSIRANQASFATLYPGAWSFIAVSWQEVGDRCTFRYWAGKLGENELTFGEHDSGPIADAKPMFLLAGRRADQSSEVGGLPSLLFEGGLFSNFAVYNTPLPEETVQRIYLAASRP